MSHFTVLVVGDDVEKQLAQFQENNCGDCPKEYLEFNEVEEEYRKEYEEDSVKMVQAPNGERFYTWDDHFKVGDSIFDRKTVIPEDYVTVQVAHKDRYATFDEFIRDWAGYTEQDPETGKYGYWENPRRKWDWFQIGGRWTGFFKLKEGAKGEVGCPGIMTNPASPGYVDQARKRDIDFTYMRDEAGQKAAEKYDEVISVLGEHLDNFIPWDKMRDEVHHGDIDAARDAYHDQPAKKALAAVGNADLCWINIEDFLCTKEEYIERARRKAFCAFAVLMNGEWYERGKMGWWACVSDEKGDWEEEFERLLDSISDDTLLTVVDCHI